MKNQITKMTDPLTKLSTELRHQIFEEVLLFDGDKNLAKSLEAPLNCCGHHMTPRSFTHSSLAKTSGITRQDTEYLAKNRNLAAPFIVLAWEHCDEDAEPSMMCYLHGFRGKPNSFALQGDVASRETAKDTARQLQKMETFTVIIAPYSLHRPVFYTRRGGRECVNATIYNGFFNTIDDSLTSFGRLFGPFYELKQMEVHIALPIDCNTRWMGPSISRNVTVWIRQQKVWLLSGLFAAMSPATDNDLVANVVIAPKLSKVDMKARHRHFEQEWTTVPVNDSDARGPRSMVWSLRVQPPLHRRLDYLTDHSARQMLTERSYHLWLYCATISFIPVVPFYLTLTMAYMMAWSSAILENRVVYGQSVPDEVLALPMVYATYVFYAMSILAILDMGLHLAMICCNLLLNYKLRYIPVEVCRRWDRWWQVWARSSWVARGYLVLYTGTMRSGLTEFILTLEEVLTVLGIANVVGSGVKYLYRKLWVRDRSRVLVHLNQDVDGGISSSS
ncbi:hypothetical protein EJ08DRAFT_512870 [Tothia fuscella]|uniref:Uncharacterized protein n=1 Tax=Tothia fuscella TaxID=1048955 RepID=A0A9P4P081_9PEZI|nr:hypothetical protein EJ08DRAFT_512870 [Tothia fuscella]